VTLRADLLSGRRIVLAGGGSQPDPMSEQLRALGASVDHLSEEVLLGARDDAAGWSRARAPLHAAVIDAAGSFGPGGADRLTATLELAWRAAWAVATGALIEAGQPGRLLFIAPRPDAGPHAEAARAALENLARTLSVEWARFEITAVALTPGPATTDAEVAELACFLVSPAGGYFSGCRFDLGATPVST
jgi:NAD(P)-dependent dehydrogenase (short-subunit alcohol dehydrogenase family)